MRSLVVVLLCLTFLLPVAVFGQSHSANTPATLPVQPGDFAFETALQYLVVFYPRWFTYQTQSPPSPENTWVGPNHMTPTFGAVVAPNDDTLYVSSFMNLAAQPLIVTIPENQITLSLLTMDSYGDVFQTAAAPPNALGHIPPGVYGLTGPGWQGTLPSGVKPVPVPLNWSIWIIRADKYSPEGVDQTLLADEFRRSLHVTTLSEYLQNPNAGPANIVPVIFYHNKYKSIADDMIATDPIEFLTQLQTSVHSSSTSPFTPYEQLLSNTFDTLLGQPQYRSDLAAGAQAGHAAILARYQANLGPTNWITFTDIGAWGTDYLARSATTEYLALSNTHLTAAYYHAFEDVNGNALNTNVSSEYILTFPADQIPQARRFWSVTMYTPDSITLVSNSIDKYVVGSYTPGLQHNPDGSISIYMSPTLPAGVPQSNWLPSPQGLFDVVLRVYGPEGAVANNTYTPPGISPVQ